MAVRKSAMAALACIGLLQAQAASAQQRCITEGEAASLAIYAAPAAIRGTQSGCATYLGGNGWLARDGAAMAGRYAALAGESWPQARRALTAFAQGDSAGQNQAIGADMAALMEQLPDEALRPLVDALILQRVAQEIKPESCRNIERLLQALSRIEPRDAGALMGVILALVDLREPRVCLAPQP